MAVLMTDGAMNASGNFQVVEATNISPMSAVEASLTGVGQLIPVTFASAGTGCEGVFLAIEYASSAGSAYRDVVVSLEENVGTVTMTIASPCVATFVGHGMSAGDTFSFATTGALPTGVTVAQTYYVLATGLTADNFQFSLTAGGAAINATGSQSGTHSLWIARRVKTETSSTIVNGITGNCIGRWSHWFEFATPYTVTTAANTWRFHGYTGGAGLIPTLATSNGTAPFYATICGNTATYTANDTLILKDQLTVDQSMTLRGTLGTGDSTNGIALFIGTSATAPTRANTEGNLLWGTGGSYKITINGVLTMAAHGAIRAGTAASPITIANKGEIEFIAVTVGTARGRRQMPNFGSTNYKESCFIYGEVPTNQFATIASDTTVGGTTISLNEDVSLGTGPWIATDQIIAGKQDVVSTGNLSQYTLTGTPGTSLSLTSGLLTNVRKAGGTVLRNGRQYGFSITATESTAWTNGNDSNWVWSGMYIYNVGQSQGFASPAVNGDDTANTSQWLFQDITFYHDTTTASLLGLITGFDKGILVKRVYGYLRALGSRHFGTTTSGSIDFEDCRLVSPGTTGIGATSHVSYSEVNVSGCVIENTFVALSSAGTGPTIQDNVFWGCSTAHNFTNVVNATLDRNTYDRCTTSISFLAGVVIGCVDTDSEYAQEAANTTDILFAQSSLVDYYMKSPSGSVVVDTTTLLLTTPGSRFYITDYNDELTRDINWFTYAVVTRTGWGLPDTTVWNGTAFAAATAAGQSGVKITPLSSTIPFVFHRDYPSNSKTIGNNQNLPVAQVARIKINNAAYYAGVHTNPTLQTTYDVTSQATPSVATDTTDAQQLQTNFTPLTTASDIDSYIELATDATGTDRDVYIGYMVPITGEGILIDTTSMGEWSKAYPLPQFRSFPNPPDFWDVLVINHNITGSFGWFIQKLLTVAKFLGLK